ncbi:hypothetical protein V500_00703 [Pseudogymnoascus sp. VKM F-4518 (FW-2643)]|nr:hypothetical protein V500_00703 [Pseudogymnoascus sp. VKM F-4518 (FW-2643)]
MDVMGKVGGQLSKEVWPSFNRDICKKGKKPGLDDWPWAEKNVLIPLWKKLQKDHGVQLPPYSGELQPVVKKIVKNCVKPKYNFCNEDTLKEMKGCALQEAMGYVVSHLDISKKYGNEANCKKAAKALKSPSLWKWAKTVVVAFAKKVT